MGVGINFYPPAARSREWSSAGWLATNGGKTTIYWDRDGGRWWHKKKTRETKEETEKTEGDWDEWQRLEGNNHRDRLSKEQCLKILHIPSISFTALTVRDFVSCRMRLPSNVAHKDSFDHIWQSVPLSLSLHLYLCRQLSMPRASQCLSLIVLSLSILSRWAFITFLLTFLSLANLLPPPLSLISTILDVLGSPPGSYCPCVPPLPRSVALFLYHFASIQFDSIQVALLNLMFDERFLLKHTID